MRRERSKGQPDHLQLESHGMNLEQDVHRDVKFASKRTTSLLLRRITLQVYSDPL
jgi:hypothetical protein